MGKNGKVVPYILVMLEAALLVVFEWDVLYEIQEQNLFLHSTLFFKQSMVRSGGLLTWAGAYLTQFFYYPWLGACLLGLLWVLLMWLIKSAFRLSSAWPALVPVTCLLLTIVTQGYWVYYMKLPGHAFVPTVGAIVVTMMVWGYRGLLSSSSVSSILYILISAVVGYPFFGFYALLAVALMGIMACMTGTHRLAVCITVVAAIVAVPLVYYYMVYHETNIVNIYWTAIPVFAMGEEHFFAYYLPYIALAVSMGVMSGSSLINCHLSPLVSRISLFALLALCLAVFWYKDDNFHRELAMSHSIEKQDWEHVLAKARGVKGEPTRSICMMQNLALFRLGRPAEEMLPSNGRGGAGTQGVVNGSKRPDAPFPVRMVHTCGKMLYLQYGVPNYCYRWCMEDGVKYGWSVAGLKLMAKCHLLNGETVAAQRLLNMLKKTDFHRSWALRFETILHSPHLVPHDRELGPILPLLRADNFLTADQSQLEMFLIEHILSTLGGTPEQQELARRTALYYRHNRQKLVEP